MPKVQDIIERAWKVRDIAVCLSSFERINILVAIMQGADTYEEIMDETGMDYDKVKGQTQELKKRGVVKRERKGYGGRHGGHSKIMLALDDDMVREVASLCGVRLTYTPGPMTDIDKIISSLKQQKQ